MRLLERICETLGEDSQGFMRLCERIHGDLWDLQGFTRLQERFVGIHETLGEDLQDLGEDL